MKQFFFRLGLVGMVAVLVPTLGLSQKAQTPVAPTFLPGTVVPQAVPPTPPALIPPAPIPPVAQLPIPVRPVDRPDMLPDAAISAAQPEKAAEIPATPTIREPEERFRKPEGEPSYPDSALGHGKWCWSGWQFGPRISPNWEYPGLGGGPKVIYPWGSPGYTGRNDERSLNRTCRLWGPPYPVYTPIPESSDPQKLIYPCRNISSPGFIYGWVGPWAASPRFKNYTVNSWANPNVDLSTGWPRGSNKDKELNPPKNELPNPGDAEVKPAVNYLTLAVKVPSPSAEVYVDGIKTAQTGTNRTFSSPELEPGMKFKYEVEVRWRENGLPFEKKLSVIGSSGDVISMDFTIKEVVRAGK